ncbi:DUF58 domain-containing protein [Vibrio sp. TH_r3]|uniref:DUF58 domain-containing protein n=1 Tax=Vibrio sp. TH_r3 TaxID=3082084 RepID=UPI0029547C68|nr:DUF58 domain-containing protein [Vibrio sp. TH_r3]MDV7103296.1 DUF58 domain-containing protein [Vibrio sp. TH_r3]
MFVKEKTFTSELPEGANGVTLSLSELLHYKSQTVRWLPPAKSLWSQLNGQHISAQKGRGMNFSEVRQYQPGDDIRSIDWRVTARTGKTHTKLFTEEREQPVMLYLDFCKSMRFGSQMMLKSIQMAHMASLISWLAIDKKDRVGAILDSGTELLDIKPTSRNKGPLQLFNQLIQMHNQALTDEIGKEKPLSDGLTALHRLCPKGSDIIICSDFTRLNCTHDKIRLSRLRQHNRVSIVQFYDPLELGQTHYRGVEKVTNGQQSLWLNFATKNNRQQLKNAFKSEQNKLTSLCNSLAIPYYSISCAQPLVSQITGTTK